MNQIKKVLCVALCAAMILSFVGCGGQDNTTAQAPAQTTEQPAEEKKEEKSSSLPCYRCYHLFPLL